ncbi:hypothetical protein ACI3L3_15055 [Desulfobaculum sp. SPO524]|uniref:hypothetical protein n=1 Tax=Desulfobaculum sp. SPO524 TaxID=3378071 RepID=UPI00385515D8
MRVLVVTADAEDGKRLVAGLSGHGYAAEWAQDAVGALRLARMIRYDIALVDEMVRGVRWDAMLRGLRGLQHDVAALCMCDDTTPQYQESDAKTEACTFVTKPVIMASLLPHLLAVQERGMVHAPHADARYVL